MLTFARYELLPWLCTFWRMNARNAVIHGTEGLISDIFSIAGTLDCASRMDRSIAYVYCAPQWIHLTPWKWGNEIVSFTHIQSTPDLDIIYNIYSRVFESSADISDDVFRIILAYTSYGAIKLFVFHILIPMSFTATRENCWNLSWLNRCWLKSMVKDFSVPQTIGWITHALLGMFANPNEILFLASDNIIVRWLTKISLSLRYRVLLAGLRIM